MNRSEKSPPFAVGSPASAPSGSWLKAHECLAVAHCATGEKRYRFVPDVPTLAELGVKAFEFPAWIGVFAAKGVSTAIDDKLGKDIQAAVRSPELTAKLHDFDQEATDAAVGAMPVVVVLPGVANASGQPFVCWLSRLDASCRIRV